MTDKKPLAIKITIGLILFRLIVILLTVGLFYIIKDSEFPERSAMNGIKDGIIEHFSLYSSDLNYEFWRLVGRLLIPTLLILIILTFLINRKFWLTLITASLDLVVGISQGVPILTIIILILILSNPAKDFLKKKKNDTPTIANKA